MTVLRCVYRMSTGIRRQITGHSEDKSGSRNPFTTLQPCVRADDVSTFHVNPVGKWFRQIIHLGIRQTHLTSTKFLSSPQDPRLLHTLGVPDTKPHAGSQLFTRTQEVILCVSFNDQSQSTDISDMSTLVAM